MKPAHPLILFIVKKLYHYEDCRQISNGLRTSAMFVVNMLLAEGVRAKLVEAVDGNCVDALVSQNKPSRVVIEAIWVSPAKLAELIKLHPKVKWTVRIHSEIAFLSNEGQAVSYIVQYLKMGVEVSFNSEQTVDDFAVLGKTTYQPNYYPLRKPRPSMPYTGALDVGCFGAIRPLKNQLIQAMAASQFAKEAGVKLVFHMNGSRIEQQGNNNFKNIQAFFDATGQKLELHPWLDHEEFLELIASMDICLQVSLSESFNIVSADAVSMGVPLVGSAAIGWLPERSQADERSVESIVNAIKCADATTVIMNQHALRGYLKQTVAAWLAWVGC